MKAAIIYSGKGGVGKTTTTANIARVLSSQGKKVLILDMDINTPSMNTEFHGEHPNENLWIHSTGNIFDKFIYLEQSMVERFIADGQRKIHSINPDVVLIDTPPSITQVHIGVLSLIQVSVVIFVSQPTALSREDVIRTANFFTERCKPCVTYMVENMCDKENSDSSYDYGMEVIAHIPFIENFRSELLIEKCNDDYSLIGEKIILGADVEQKQAYYKPPYDESFDLIKVLDVGRRNTSLVAYIKRDGEEMEKEMALGPYPKFLSVRTWERMRDYVDRFERGFRHDMRIEKCSPEVIERLVKPFYENSHAYFMVVNAPLCEIQLITGEIGQATLVTNGTSHYGIPRLKYNTKKGEIILFPDEVLPVGMMELQNFIQEGYLILTDGRYLPPKETVEMCYNAYGDRVGLMDSWEKTYDMWINKEE